MSENWDKICELSLTNPILHTILQIKHRDNLTRRETLELYCIEITKFHNRLIKDVILKQEISISPYPIQLDEEDVRKFEKLLKT